MTNLHLSDSSLGSAAKCSTKVWLSKICGLTTREEAAPLKIGAAAHAGAAEWFRSGDAEKAYQVFAREYKAWAEDNVLDDDIRAWKHAHEVFWWWLNGLSADELPFTWKPEEVEQHLQVEWGVVNGVKVVLEGYVDLPVAEKVTKARWITDHKFTGWLKRDTIEGFKLSSQFKCYAWLWEQVRGEKVEGVYANVVEWTRLPQVQLLKSGKEKKCRKHGVSYSECRFHHANKQLVPMSLMPGDLELWQENANELIARITGWVREFEHLDPVEVIQHIPMEGTFSDACKWCEFKRFCMSGRQRHLVNTMLIQRKGREGKT